MRHRRETQEQKNARMVNRMAQEEFRPADGSDTGRQIASPRLMKEMAANTYAAQMGLRNYRLAGTKGDLLVFITQAYFDAADREMQCMVIAHRADPRTRQVYIPLCDLWKILEPKLMATKVAPAFAERLYGFVTKQDIKRIIDVFYDFAEDLKNAPPLAELSSKDFLRVTADDGFRFKLNDKPVN